MDIIEINKNLSLGHVDAPGLFPRLEQLKKSKFQFQIDFGLEQLPKEGGILLIRGARQYGKSTWLEQEIHKTISHFGAGSAYYLNGDNILNQEDLEKKISELLPIFSTNAKVKRIFIDEITSIPQWELVLKRIADKGILENVLIVTTGSKTTDLRRGSEKLPGRKGKLNRSVYLFTPLSYKEFHRVCSGVLGSKTLPSYLISGGSPIACAELANQGQIPPYVIELTKDWIEGEIASSGRSRLTLLNIMQTLFRYGSSALGQSKLAREAGLANNTVAQNYLEILFDLCCITPSYAWDSQRHIPILRKPCKYHFTNLLTAISYYSKNIRSPDEFLSLSPEIQGAWYEWLVAQELVRRNALIGKDISTPLAFWQNQNHALDFCLNSNEYIEVKRGQSAATEFSWVKQILPQAKVEVINTNRFENNLISGKTLEEFLLESI